ncbi:MAG TPA: hypothetical protein VGN34_31260 [Ktedonobacteraceae bacterium]|jgi:hypothetical protein
MSFEELIIELREKNVRIYDEGNAFRLQAPKGVLTAKLLGLINTYTGELLYLVRLGDVRVCPARREHRPAWRYSSSAHAFICAACRHEDSAA